MAICVIKSLMGHLVDVEAEGKHINGATGGEGRRVNRIFTKKTTGKNAIFRYRNLL